MSGATAASEVMAAGEETALAAPLLRDGWLWLNVAVLAATTAFYLLPGLDPALVADLGRRFGDLPMLAAALGAVVAGLRSLPDVAARRFWGLAAASLAMVAIVRLLYLVPYGSTIILFTAKVLFAVFYLCLVLAVRSRPHRPAPAGDARMRRVELGASVLFVGTLFAYYVGIPQAGSGGTGSSWASPLLYYATLDLFLLLALVRLLRAKLSDRWWWSYALLAAAILVWLGTDLYEGLIYLGLATWIGYASPLNAVWVLPVALVGMAARVGRRTPPAWLARRTPRRRAAAADPREVGILGYALILPALHLVVSLTGVLGEETARAREAVVLAALAAFLLLAHVRQRRLDADLARQRQVQAGLERQLRQAHRTEALGTLAGGIAHDFNNLLTGILGHAELMRPQLPPRSPLAADLDGIVAGADRARALTAQLLAFSRRPETTRTTADLRAAVAEVLAMLRPLPPRVLLEEDLAPVGRVRAEPSQLRQVVVNLVTNAVQAVAERGAVRVALHEALLDGEAGPGGARLAAGRYAVLEVEDNGEGMSAETLERLYDPFFTTRRLGHGAGLGLSVVHGIVATLGGAVVAESELGAGSVFRVYLPVLAVAAEKPRPAAPPPEPLPEPVPEAAPEPAPEPRRRHLLLVDDEAMVVRVLERLLAASAYRVTATTDPEEALARLAAAPGDYDLVLSDQRMPRMTGLDLARRVRQDHPELPVVLMSGYSDDLSVEQLAAAGVAAVLSKPVRSEELVGAVERVLAGAATACAAV